MKKWNKGLIIAVLSVLLLVSCSESKQNDSEQVLEQSQGTIVANAKKGLVIFSANCVSCHGSLAKGTDQGPPLVHKIYNPSHHSDYSIERAVKLGTRSHHWSFGDMAPVPGLSSEDITHVIAYIRQEQLKKGIK